MNCPHCSTWLAGDGVEEEKKFNEDGTWNVHTAERCRGILSDRCKMLNERISELEDQIDLDNAEKDINMSYGRNKEAADIEIEILKRRGWDWRGALTSRQKKDREK